MAKALGVGGIFFRADDPKALGEWYAAHLGISIEEFGGAVFQAPDVPAGGYTIWNPFDRDTDYFGPSGQTFMFNLMVDDIDGALAQVAEGGAEVIPDREDSEFGRFGWFVDPNGNRVELWQPPEA